MREILFRAKRIDNGEWVEGYYGIKGKGTDIENHYIMVSTFQSGIGNYDYMFYFTDVHIDSKTLCQFTGLKDKNGNKIWENDIVKCNKRKDGFEFYKVLWRKYYADFGVEPLEFGIQYPIGLGENEQDIKGCNYEVIGNIFDNPELLKGD